MKIKGRAVGSSAGAEAQEPGARGSVLSAIFWPVKPEEKGLFLTLFRVSQPGCLFLMMVTSLCPEGHYFAEAHIFHL